MTDLATIRFSSSYYKNWKGQAVPYGMYSDNTPLVKTDIREISENADTLIVRPKVLMDLIVALFLVDSVTQCGGLIERLILPYVPGARQDRINFTGDVLFTSASVASLINDRPFNLVKILDPHSTTIRSFIRNVAEYPLGKVADMLPNTYDGVIAPDKGAMRRAAVFAAAMGHRPLIQAEKQRDPSNGVLSGFAVKVEKGKHYLVADDICDGGGTFIGLAEKIKEQGATADLYVSHGIFSKGTKHLRQYYKNIYSTNSLAINDSAEVNVLDVITPMEGTT